MMEMSVLSSNAAREATEAGLERVGSSGSRQTWWQSMTGDPSANTSRAARMPDHEGSGTLLGVLVVDRHLARTPAK